MNRRKAIYFFTILYVILSCAVSSSFAQENLSKQQTAEQQATEQAVTMVETAIQHYKKFGAEKTFTEISDISNPKFHHDDLYVFVYDYDGNVKAHGANPYLVGKNLLDYQDDQGKFLIKEMISKIISHGQGWVTYRWPHPIENIIQDKKSYVARLDDDYWIGVGVYIEPQIGTKDEAVEMVEDVIRYFNEHGEDKTFKAIMDKKNQRFHKKDLYAFIYDYRGRAVAHGATPIVVGRFLHHYEDENGKKVIQNSLKTIQRQEKGWINYRWPHPHKNQVVTKHTYIARLSDKYWVGVGIHETEQKASQQDAIDIARNLTRDYHRKGPLNTFDQVTYHKLSDLNFKDLIVYVADYQGTVFAHNTRPNQVGQNITTTVAYNDPNYADQLLNKVKNEGNGWVYLSIPQQSKQIIYNKSTFVSRLDNDYWLGIRLETETESATPEQAVAMVEATAAYYKQHGKEKTFREVMNMKNENFHFKDLYPFIYDYKGNVVAHGARPLLVGQNLIDHKDDFGTLPVKKMIDLLQKKDSGWIKYRWPHPISSAMLDKVSYIKRLDDDYWVGVGVHKRIEVANKQEALNMIDKVFNYYTAHGTKKTFDAIMDLKALRFHEKDLYIFAYDFEGNVVAHGARPHLVGENLIGLRDEDGKFIIEDAIKLVKNKEKGWISYRWPHPIVKTVENKMSYVIRLNDKYWIGTGIYKQ